MSEQFYLVKYSSGGAWRYLTSPDMNDTSAKQADAYVMDRETAAQVVRLFRRYGFQQVRMAPIKSEK